MQNLWKFLLKYSPLLLFFMLEVAAMGWFFLNEPLPRSSMLAASNTVVAGMNSGASGLSGYFSLSRTNRDLAAENARLSAENARLRSMEEALREADSLYAYAHLQWDYLPAKVVDMQTGTQHNYLVLNKGGRDSVRVGQGVLSHSGVVGVVSAVNSHFSLVTPVIHPKMHVSCRLKNSGDIGFLQWRVLSCSEAYLTDIARHVKVSVGDTVVTSGLTRIFPEDVPVGVIEETSIGDGDTYHTLKMRLAADFRSIRYVQIVNNPLNDLQDSLLQ